MSFNLPELPFSRDALAPFMSAETLEYHHGKHHAGYVGKLNAAIEGTENAGKSLEEIIMSAEGGLFNNAAQHWNHSFFWSCLKPGGGGEPQGDVADAINRDFGSYAAFREQFANTCAAQFGSGWGWLVLDKGKLAVTSTGNADLPMKHGQVALATIDVWEHAYYIDYRNARPNFVAAIIDKLLNWDFVAQNLKAGGSSAAS
ncbi:MAG: superoxide dismutase [Nannocystaceae bacterium]